MSPKAFISYCWSSPDHEKWVISLATQLRENGVDVLLDKWDLKEGHDAVMFMERMVADPDVNKVIVVLDQLYAEKADGRKGGVGTETQIISAEVYKKADQNKFVGVIAERNSDGAPFLPTYYKSRIYIDLSDPDSYASNFDQLLRWIFDKPLHTRPELGRPPEFLKDNAVALGTESRARRAIDLLRSGAQGANGALDEYLATFADGMEKFRLAVRSNDTFLTTMLSQISMPSCPTGTNLSKLSAQRLDIGLSMGCLICKNSSSAPLSTCSGRPLLQVGRIGISTTFTLSCMNYFCLPSRC
jgi:hypothetical protein